VATEQTRKTERRLLGVFPEEGSASVRTPSR
jgi:hypothetical protein